MMSTEADEAHRARAAGRGGAAGGPPQDEAPRARPLNDVDSRAHEAGAGAARHDLAAAQEEEATAHGGREAILGQHLDPDLHGGARMAETDPGLARAVHTHRNPCSQLHRTLKRQVMALQKALCRQTHSNIINSRLRRRQRHIRLQTSP